MKARWLICLTLGMWVVWPAAVSACDFYLAYTPMGMQSTSMAIGGGVNVIPGEGDEDTFFVPSVDLGIRLGDRLVVNPAVGLCTGGDETEFTAGGGASLNLFNSEDGSWSVGAQSHLAWASFEGGSEITVPIMGAVTIAAGDNASIYGGAGVQVYRVSIDEIDDSETDTNPAGFAGVSFGMESLQISGGVTVVSTDDDTDFGFVGGVSIPLGS